jgi:hypothetical protein
MALAKLAWQLAINNRRESGGLFSKVDSLTVEKNLPGLSAIQHGTKLR